MLKTHIQTAYLPPTSPGKPQEACVQPLAPASREKQKVGTPPKAPLSPSENILWQSLSKSQQNQGLIMQMLKF